MRLLTLNLSCENVKYPARKHFEKTNSALFGACSYSQKIVFWEIIENFFFQVCLYYIYITVNFQCAYIRAKKLDNTVWDNTWKLKLFFLPLIIHTPRILIIFQAYELLESGQ